MEQLQQLTASKEPPSPLHFPHSVTLQAHCKTRPQFAAVPSPRLLPRSACVLKVDLKPSVAKRRCVSMARALGALV